jgi:hypothetical protein
VSAVEAEQRLTELPDHACSAEVAEGVAASVRPDDRALRKLVARPVVIGDDDLEACLLRRPDFLDGGDPAVDGEDEAHALAGETRQRLAAHAVALLEPARQVVGDVGAELAQDEHRQRRRANAVGVVVAVDADPRPGRNGRADRLARLAHVAEQERIVRRQPGLEERARVCRVGVAAAHEHRREHVAHAQLGAERLDLGPLARAPQLPRHGQPTVRGPPDGASARTARNVPPADETVVPPARRHV